MFIWTIKLFSTVRRAIAGRKYPAQLAWAVALGGLLGLIPHGNLIALMLLLVILSLKINHAMAGLTTIGVSFAASYLDPYSHQLGQYLLTEPQFVEVASQAWSLPLVPWTQLNNTVVLGSFLLGTASIVPVFMITYPIFRWFAPAGDPKPGQTQAAVVPFEEIDSAKHQVVLVDREHRTIAKPHPTPATVPTEDADPQSDRPAAATTDPAATTDRAVGAATAEDDAADRRDVTVETRIDVIRMKDYRDANPAATGAPAATGEDDAEPDPQQPMDEALNYLLRQLRDSQQRKVA